MVGARARALLTLAGLGLRAGLIMLAGAILYGLLRLVGRAPGQAKRTAAAGYQTQESRRGEVAYRQRAAFGEPDAVLKLAETRAARRTIFQSLAQRGVVLSPFVELGAERGQTALLLNAEFGATGAAADLSLHSLQVVPILRAHFGYATEPLAVCCDATHLPFRNGALSFAFCFATLHHFDDMRPVLAEVRRVLGRGGRFFFDEEPLKRTLCLNLYRCPRGDQMSRLDRFLHRHQMLEYIAEAFVGSKEEVEYGIVEKQSTGLHEWESLMGVFDRVELGYAPLESGDCSALRAALVGIGMSAEQAQSTAAGLFGAVIHGLCSVDAGPEPATAETFLASFICPNCSAPLRFEGRFVCPSCGPFEQRGNVHMLLPRALQEALYA